MVRPFMVGVAGPSRGVRFRWRKGWSNQPRRGTNPRRTETGDALLGWKREYDGVEAGDESPQHGARSLKTALCGHVRNGGVYGSRNDDGGGRAQLTNGRDGAREDARPLLTLSLDSRLGGQRPAMTTVW